MSPDQAIDQLAEQFGVLPTFFDLGGNEQRTSLDTKRALLRANGLVLDTEIDILKAAQHHAAPQSQPALPEEIVCNSNRPHQIGLLSSTQWQIVLEDGKTVDAGGSSDGQVTIPALPSGLHHLHMKFAGKEFTARLIAAPPAAPALIDQSQKNRIWGINAALYGLHSQSSPGIGNFDHLTKTARICASQGADFIGINPVHAIGWNSHQIISPYSPTHRGYLNPLHIAADQVPHASENTGRLMAAWKQAHHQLASRKTVDHAQHASHLRPLLKALYVDFCDAGDDVQRREFDKFCLTRGVDLARFAHFEKLSGELGTVQTNWPADLTKLSQRPIEGDNYGAGESSRFHAWLQWIAHQQLALAQSEALNSGMALGLYLDLAVGARRDGAEAWCESESIADGVSVGAPPDHLSPAGQNWNLAAYAPAKLAANNYQAFRTILRQTMDHCGIIRIDHVLGLNRSFWIPDDGAPGGYIKQNFEAMLALIRIEAERSNTIVVGEDLGLVPDGFRETLATQNIYSYGVLQYEKNHDGKFRQPSELRENSLICFGTHDTPTLAGFQQGRDIDWWHKLGWIDSAQAETARRERAHDLEQLARTDSPQADSDEITFPELRTSVYGALASSNTAMVSVQLDDIFGQVEAQNLPGTVDEHANWQQMYRDTVEDLATNQQLTQMSGIMTAQGRCNSRVSLGESKL